VRDRGKQMCGKAGKGRSPLSISKRIIPLKVPPELGSSPTAYLDTLCLFNGFLVNQEKVLYFLELKFEESKILRRGAKRLLL